MIKRLLKRFKYYKGNKKWKKDFWFINQVAHLTRREFYWFQLVHQEIEMYIMRSETVSEKNMMLIAIRRGFNDIETNYLREMLKYLKMYRN